MSKSRLPSNWRYDGQPDDGIPPELDPLIGMVQAMMPTIRDQVAAHRARYNELPAVLVADLRDPDGRRFTEMLVDKNQIAVECDRFVSRGRIPLRATTLTREDFGRFVRDQFPPSAVLPTLEALSRPDVFLVVFADDQVMPVSLPLTELESL